MEQHVKRRHHGDRESFNQRRPCRVRQRSEWDQHKITLHIRDDDEAAHTSEDLFDGLDEHLVQAWETVPAVRHMSRLHRVSQGLLQLLALSQRVLWTPSELAPRVHHSRVGRRMVLLAGRLAISPATGQLRFASGQRDPANDGAGILVSERLVRRAEGHDGQKLSDEVNQIHENHGFRVTGVPLKTGHTALRHRRVPEVPGVARHCEPKDLFETCVVLVQEQAFQCHGCGVQVVQGHPLGAPAARR
mmetsp:Transcript_15282/g.58134  ORF Transcript_15282/g.58134 Transcript_15282/m.58134 type:complete len:246 (+) Transcript_15282:2019-2756(+)